MNTFKKRIDELGRIVIPMEIRKQYKIKNFDELELIAQDDSILIKKTIGLELYKEKIDNVLSFISSLLNFKLFVFSTNKLISSNYDMDKVSNIDINFNILLNNNNCMNSIQIGDKTIGGYVYVDSLIVDSNLFGYIMFISKEKFDNLDIFKKAKKIIIDLIV